MKDRKKKRISPWVAVLTGVAGLVVGGGVLFAVMWSSLGGPGMTLVQAYQIISHRFVGDYDPQESLEATLGAMVDSLGDRWSYYLTPEEARQVKEARQNSYVGIGITVSRDSTDGLHIQSVTLGGPADEAGIQAGEIICAVDGVAVTQENREDSIARIKGEEGSVLTLEVQGSDGARRSVEVTRKTVHGISAQWHMMDNGIGRIDIYNFYSGTAEQVRTGVEELMEQGAMALVFDVRNNPGGYVTELTAMLDFLLPEGRIFVSQEYNGKETVYTSDASCVSLPMAVLVNGESYSAAEFFAAQLRESVDAVVAGTKTSGKGYSQMLFSLQDGSAIGLSTARYFTGSGVSLIGTGLDPDPSVELTEAAKEKLLLGQLPESEDLQLQAAVKALHLEG